MGVRGLLAAALGGLLLTGCTLGASGPAARAGDVLQPPPPRTPEPGPALPVVREPWCEGSPSPRPSPQYARSYLDLVQVGGRTYVLATPQPAAVRRGARRAQVRCTYDEGRSPASRPVVDGDASFLPPGTPLHDVVPAPPSPALVADLGDRQLLYELLPGS